MNTHERGCRNIFISMRTQIAVVYLGMTSITPVVPVNMKDVLEDFCHILCWLKSYLSSVCRFRYCRIAHTWRNIAWLALIHINSHISVISVLSQKFIWLSGILDHNLGTLEKRVSLKIGQEVSPLSLWRPGGLSGGLPDPEKTWDFFFSAKNNTKYLIIPLFRNYDGLPLPFPALPLCGVFALLLGGATNELNSIMAFANCTQHKSGFSPCFSDVSQPS